MTYSLGSGVQKNSNLKSQLKFEELNNLGICFKEYFNLKTLLNLKSFMILKFSQQFSELCDMKIFLKFVEIFELKVRLRCEELYNLEICFKFKNFTSWRISSNLKRDIQFRIVHLKNFISYSLGSTFNLQFRLMH